MKVTEVSSKSCRKFLRTCETLQILFTDKCPSVSLISFKKKIWVAVQCISKI